MSRAIVHKTKGKLDLRAITVFGMNAKPESINPIGYFGTGLKYAVAVLARHNIPVTFWIDGKKWTIEKNNTKFRDKDFQALRLSTSRGRLLGPRTIDLPFTTELGKNWELWQAFRELESNTRDEKGMTFVAFPEADRIMINGENQLDKGFTHIVVEDERYVQCWMDRDKVFLPEAWVARPDSNTRVQAFNKKSNHIYYRGIRIYDLEEPSENTYNILSQLSLTEDRTLKGLWEAQYAIEQFLQETDNKEVVTRAVKAPAQSFEGRLDYDYISLSNKFLNAGREAGSAATAAIKAKIKEHTPPAIRETYTNWIRAFIGSIERGDYDAVEEIAAGEHREELLNILRTAASEHEKEEINNSQSFEAVGPESVNYDD